MMTMGGTFGAVRMTLSVTITTLIEFEGDKDVEVRACLLEVMFEEQKKWVEQVGE